MAKIKSNLHTRQYAGGVSYDHGQRQALVEPLLLPGVARNVDEFLCKLNLLICKQKDYTLFAH